MRKQCVQYVMPSRTALSSNHVDITPVGKLFYFNYIHPGLIVCLLHDRLLVTNRWIQIKAIQMVFTILSHLENRNQRRLGLCG